jgi:ferredoxin
MDEGKNQTGKLTIVPKITAQGKEFDCEMGANLRRVLLDHDIDLYNGNAKIINCMGIGTCGTCAVQIEGKVNAANWQDIARRSLPPHDANRNLRLACKTQVMGDIKVTKFDRFWGQGQDIAW